jgi:polygalacturonase
MAQHDYIIANQSGAAFRSDLNNGLAAIVSQNSGAAQPSTTYAYQWWADTTTGLLKLRNAANNAWITVGTLASANLGLIPAGAASIVNADVNASAGIVASKLSFTQAGSGAAARTIDSKLKELVSVKDFGAVGDGVADDTAAIQAAPQVCKRRFKTHG